MSRHTNFYVKDASKISYCGKTWGWQFSVDSYEIPFEISPTKGEHDPESCPQCQESLVNLTNRYQNLFDGKTKRAAFPLCCINHKKLTELAEFKHGDFVNTPKWFAQKVVYTNAHIKNNYSKEDWYNSITDYFDWNHESFGKMPEHLGEPLFLGDYLKEIKFTINNFEDLSKFKKNRLLKHIDNYYKKREPNNDLQELLSIYQKWLEIFPFDLSLFNELKTKYEKHLPILNGIPQKNPYSGMSRVKMHTKDSLFDMLQNLTRSLITEINTLSMHEKGLLTDPEALQLELILKARKHKNNFGYNLKAPLGQKNYTETIQNWYSDEVKFMQDIYPFLSKVEKVTPQNYNSHIFKSLKAFNLFELLVSKMVKPRTGLSDYSYIFAKMKKDEFMFPIPQQVYFDFIQEYNGFALSRVKTLTEATTEQRESLYSICKDSLK